MAKIQWAAAVVLVCALLVTGVCAQSCGGPVPEQQTAVSSDEHYVDIVLAGLEIGWLGSATCESYVACYPNTTKCQIVSELQCFQDDHWETIASWDAIGTTTAEAQHTKFVSKGYTYRVKSTGYAYVGNTCKESLIVYSNEVTY